MAKQLYDWRVRMVSALELEAELNDGLSEEARQKSGLKNESYNVEDAFDLYAVLPVPNSDRLFAVIARREIE